MGAFSTSIVLCSHNQKAFLKHALDSILNQEQACVECVVVDFGSTDGSTEILQTYRERIQLITNGHPSPVEALNEAFSRTRGDAMLWLDAADKLCPWACRLTTFVLECFQVQWLTSSTPLAWSPSQMGIADGLGDGYAKIPFFQGRNLKTSSYFHHPIWRSGTVWRRSLWHASGSRVNYSLADAGDYELWIRFWQHADLTTLPIPIAGRQALASQGENDAYWRAAESHLQNNGALPTPSPLTLAIKRQLQKRIPSLRARFSYPSPHISIAASTEECAITRHMIL